MPRIACARARLDLAAGWKWANWGVVGLLGTGFRSGSAATSCWTGANPGFRVAFGESDKRQSCRSIRLGHITRMDENPYPHRRMSRFWRWHVRIFVVACVATFGLIIWRDSSWYGVVPFAVGALLMLHMHLFVPCPHCSRRLRARLVKEHYRPDSWRYLYDCSECQITWDSQYVQSPAD